MIIELSLVNGCIDDESSTTFAQDDIIYNIGLSGTVAVDATWAVGSCPYALYALRIENGIARLFNTAERQLITFSP